MEKKSTMRLTVGWICYFCSFNDPQTSAFMWDNKWREGTHERAPRNMGVGDGGIGLLVDIVRHPLSGDAKTCSRCMGPSKTR